MRGVEDWSLHLYLNAELAQLAERKISNLEANSLHRFETDIPLHFNLYLIYF